ncbi:MAG TPA: nucleotide exchange factor GrpE [Bacteroidetes bacterium]|nr:nucleotide exchange factor GrpE [Bacteroidota bacterium]
MGSKENKENNKKTSKRKSPVTKYKEQLEEKNQEIKELEDKYLRLFAEFENYKKRVRKEKEDLIATASENVLNAILPVLDDFDRAKKLSDDENSPEHFTEGVELVYDKLFSILKNKGLEKMDSLGKDFDPELHEAVAEVPVEEDKKGKIIDVIENGYTLNGKIIRYPKVVVGK